MEKILHLCFLLCIAFMAKGDDIEDETKLYDKLFSEKNYNRNIRPPLNITGSVAVIVGLELVSIIGLDEAKSSLTIQGRMKFSWKDKRLQWNPEDYGLGISELRVPIEKVWQPDITLFNPADGAALQYSTALAVVNSRGDVLYVPSAILKSTCFVDMTYFPYDTQKCSIKFGSWAYHDYQISLDNYEEIEVINQRDYSASQEWEVTSTTAKHNIYFYLCCQEPYPHVTYTLNLKRRGHLFGLVYVAPIVFLAILCPILFLLPYSVHQRFSLGGCFLICLVILLSSLEKIYPLSQGTLPHLAKYYISVIVLLVLNLLLSAGIMNCADRSSRPNSLPRIIKKVFVDGLGKVLCVSSESDDAYLNEEGQEKSSKKIQNNDWHAFATVLDRFFFVCYVILTVILSLVFLVRA